LTRLIAINSFHRGAGKTLTAVNLSVALALKGWRVAVVDADLQSPGVHNQFGIPEQIVDYSLNDYLDGRSSIQQATYNITPQLKAEMSGQVYLTPASIHFPDIVRIARQGYNLDVLSAGLADLGDKLNLDAILIDMHAGIDEQSLALIALSSTLIIVMRLEQGEYQGTGVTVDVARKLDVSEIRLAVNQAPSIYPYSQIEQQVQEAFHCPLLMSIPLAQEVMQPGGGVFVLNQPQHTIAAQFTRAAESLIAR
jgi:MinD-like ATPase involved in chromosome partitioning or flagellar assembly